MESLEQVLSTLEKKSLIDIIIEVERSLSLEHGARTLIKNIIDKHVLQLSSASGDVVQQKRIFEKKKPHRPFEFSRFRTRHVAVQLQYDGGGYFGFASQAGEHENTVEKHLFEALTQLRLIQSRQDCGYSRCGRTDRGVSALGQIVAFRLRSAFPRNIPEDSIPLHPFDSLLIEEQVTPSAAERPDEVSAVEISVENSKKRSKSSGSKPVKELDFCSQLNKTLPEDIKAVGWTEVTDDFSSRFSASHRTYRYFFVKRSLDINAMSQAAALLVGEHDFRNFCKMDVASVSNYRREIYTSHITLIREDAVCPEHSMYRLEISGIAFLWHMVRCIMAVLFLVGEGKESPDIVVKLLDIERVNAKPDYLLADEHPLVLHQCGFDHLIIKYQAKTLSHLNQHLEDIWAKHEIAAARARNALDFIRECYVRADDVNDLIVSFVDRKETKSATDKHNGKRKRPTAVETLCEGSVDSSSTREPEFVKWGDAWPKVQQSRKDSSSYRPLLERKPGLTYDERVNQISGGRKIRLARSKELLNEDCAGDGCRAEDSVLSVTGEISTTRHDSFFTHMRKQGSKE